MRVHLRAIGKGAIPQISRSLPCFIWGLEPAWPWTARDHRRAFGHGCKAARTARGVGGRGAAARYTHTANAANLLERGAKRRKNGSGAQGMGAMRDVAGPGLGGADPYAAPAKLRCKRGLVVGSARFERATSASQTQNHTKLDYDPPQGSGGESNLSCAKGFGLLP